MPAGRKTAGPPQQIAPGLYLLTAGPGALASNVYFARCGGSWALIDAAWPHQEEPILAAAGALFGPGARPAAILLTHIHPDHTGAALALARHWQVGVYAHPLELPMAPGEYLPEYANPLDRWLVWPLMSLLPARLSRRMAASASLQEVIRPLPEGPGLPGLPDWRYLPTPGHTPGHVAFFRPADRVLVTGDAVLTTDLNSLAGLLSRRATMAGPPRYTSWDWAAARKSVARLAALEPRVLAPGHGRPVTGPAAAAGLHTLAARLAAVPAARPGRPAGARPRAAEGFLRPVSYCSRTRYRPPPRAYQRLQWLGPLLTRLGASPRDVLTLEVPGRRTGLIRRTTVLQTACGGEHYLVALAGESQWVRNVRAAQGRVVLGRRQRHAARLTEIPAEQRAPVIRAYLLRGSRRPGSPAVAREARAYFGVGADAPLAEIGRIARHYPVFRIAGDGAPWPASARGQLAAGPPAVPSNEGAGG